MEDEGLEDEYDNEEEDRFAVLAQRRMAIEELAAMGYIRLIQKRKRSMKKDSPEGLSFFVSERDYCEQKFCSYFFTGRCSFIMTYYANCVILNVFSDCCLQNIQEKLMQNLLVNEWWIANSNFLR